MLWVRTECRISIFRHAVKSRYRNSWTWPLGKLEKSPCLSIAAWERNQLIDGSKSNPVLQQISYVPFLIVLGHRFSVMPQTEQLTNKLTTNKLVACWATLLVHPKICWASCSFCQLVSFVLFCDRLLLLWYISAVGLGLGNCWASTEGPVQYGLDWNAYKRQWFDSYLQYYDVLVILWQRKSLDILQNEVIPSMILKLN